MKTIIITDSDYDLPVGCIDENYIRIIPFSYHLNGKDYIDDHGKSMGYKEFYDEIRNGGMPTTSQITTYAFQKMFRQYTSEGYSIIYIGFSSALSGTFNNAVMAREALLEEDPSADITIIDSKSASVGQGLIVFHACEMLKQGESKEQIVKWVEDNKLRVNHWFTIDSLDHLKRGGRISAASAAIGTLLEVKPVLNVDDDGKLNIIKKVRGRKKSIRTMVDILKSKIVNPEEQTIIIGHGDCPEEAEYFKDMVINEVKVKNVMVNYIGPIIGTHTGPGMLSVVFFGENRLV